MALCIHIIDILDILPQLRVILSFHVIEIITVKLKITAWNIYPAVINQNVPILNNLGFAWDHLIILFKNWWIILSLKIIWGGGIRQHHIEPHHQRGQGWRRSWGVGKHYISSAPHLGTILILVWTWYQYWMNLQTRIKYQRCWRRYERGERGLSGIRGYYLKQWLDKSKE